MSFGFGALPPISPSPEDLARLFNPALLGAPQAFVAPPAMTEADVQRMEAQTGMVPPAARPAPLPMPAQPQLPPTMTPPAFPMPPARPAGFGFGPVEPPAPAVSAPPAPSFEPATTGSTGGPMPQPAEPSFLSRLGSTINNNRDLLLHLGIGLMSQPTFGGGVAAGMQSAQSAQRNKRIEDLANVETALKVQEYNQKRTQEEGTLSGNAAIIKQAYPNWTDEQARAAASNGAVLTDAVKRINDPNADRRTDTDSSGVTRWLDTGQPVFPGDQGRPTRVTDPVELMKQRRATVQAMGGDPEDPRYRDFYLTGDLPKETQQQLTAPDKKAIYAAEDAIAPLNSTLDGLKRARDLNRQTYEGAGAGWRGTIGTALPDWAVPDAVAEPKKAEATREFNQLMSLESIKSMSETLKGATTDREMATFVEILGNPSTPPNIRERTLDRMINLAERQKEVAQSRVNDLRGGTYFKPGQGPVSTPSQGIRVSTPEEASKLPSGTPIILPDGTPGRVP